MSKRQSKIDSSKSIALRSLSSLCLSGVHYKLKPKIAAQFAGVFVFMRLSTCMLNERFRITLARIPWGEVITSKNPKLLRNLRVFCFYALVNMHVKRKVQDYAGAYSLGGGHNKPKPKIAVQFAGVFVFFACQHVYVFREVQDYAGAYSLGGVHYKLKPKIAAQFAGVFGS